MTIVRNPAPAWKADAVVDEDFKTISSADLKGKCACPRASWTCRDAAAE